MSEDSEADPPEVGEVDDGAFAGPGGEIRFRRYRPLGAADGQLPTLIYYHGGGFVIGNIETHDSTCRRLANKSRCQVISIDYRLSPEHPFPAPIDDGVAAFRHIRDNAASFGADPSAHRRRRRFGGRRHRRRGLPGLPRCRRERGPAFQMLIYPATDSQPQSASRMAFAEGYFLTKELMDWFWKAYVPAGTDLADLRLSPLLAKDFSRPAARLRADRGLRPAARRGPRLCRPADRCRHQDDLRELSRHHPRLLLADPVPEARGSRPTTRRRR